MECAGPPHFEESYTQVAMRERVMDTPECPAGNNLKPVA